MPWGDQELISIGPANEFIDANVMGCSMYWRKKKLELRRRRQRHGGGSGYCWSEVQVWTWFVCKVKDIVEFHWKMSVTKKKILSLILNDSQIWPLLATNFFALQVWEVNGSYWEWHIFRMTMKSLMPMSWAVVHTEAEKRTIIAAVMAAPWRWRRVLLIRGSILNLIFL